MPRWPEWFRKVGETATHPAALDVGRKLLGYLATRRETPGVQTLVKRVTLDDGTTVEASFIGDQPRVIVYAPDGQETCELYVESGMLDLGPNIAADASARFNRGMPEFDDRPATLHFGNSIACAEGTPGLNGKIRVDARTRQVSSQCLPKNGKSITSRLKDPVKKQAQALFPASCWSGMMRRYVQAIYGGQTVAYKAGTGGLIVNGITLGCTHEAVTGLIALGSALVFVTIEGTTGRWYALRFKTCGAVVWKAAEAARRAGKTDLADRLLTVALSDAMPDARRGGVIAGEFPALEEISVYGWQFSGMAPVASLVGIEHPNHVVLARAQFSGAATGVNVACATDERVKLPSDDIACIVSRPWKGDRMLGGGDYLAPGETVDHPVMTWYDDSGNRVVVRYSVSAASPGPATTEGAECLDAYGINTFDDIPNDVVEAPLTCRVAPTFPRPTPGYTFSPLRRSPLTTLVNGVYAQVGETVLWSTVETVSAIAAARKATSPPDAAPEECVSMQAGITVAGFPTVDHSVRTTTLYAAGSVIPDIVVGADIRPPNVVNSSISGGADCRIIATPAGRECTYGQCEAGECTQQALYSSAAMGVAWTTLPSGCAVRADTATDPPHIPVVASSEVTCTHNCRTVRRRSVVGGLVVGKLSCILQPLGDTRRVAVLSAYREGLTDAFGYSSYYEEDADVRQECESPTHGECAGTVTLHCAGGPFPATPDKEHAPHNDVADYSFDTFGRNGYFKDAWTVGQVFSRRRLARRIKCRIALVGFDSQHMPLLAEGSAIEWREGFVDSVAAVTPDLAFAQWQPADVPAIEFIGGGNCPTFSGLVRTDVEDMPILVDSAAGSRRLEVDLLNLTSGAQTFQQGFAYRTCSSLLGSLVFTPAASMLQFGESIGMDRQTITGGYPKVSTPSFVGWA